jgi:hypothetical protein
MIIPVTIELVWKEVPRETFVDWCNQNLLSSDEGSAEITAKILELERWLLRGDWFRSQFGISIKTDEGHNGEGNLVILGEISDNDFVEKIWSRAYDTSLGEYALVKDCLAINGESPLLPLCVEYPHLMFILDKVDWAYLEDEL